LKVKWIVCSPQFDVATTYSRFCAEEIVDFLKEKEEEFIWLDKDDAVRKKVESALKENPEATYLFFDHGERNHLVGQNHKAVIDLDNVELLGKRVNYVLACLSASVLGAEAMEKEAIAYVGYTEVVAFVTGKAWKKFQKAFVSGFYAIYEGKEWREVYEHMIETYNEIIDQFLEEGDYMSASSARWDRDCLVVYNHHKPKKPCPARRILRRILGWRIAFRISRKAGLGIVLTWLGIGLAVHDFILEAPKIADPYRLPPHGFWFGILFIIVGFFLLSHEYVKWLRQR